MSVRIRLTRIGARKDPVWRVVVADQRSPRDGRAIETVGHYNAQTEPSTIVLNEERIRAWMERSAQPTRTLAQLIRTQNISAERWRVARAARGAVPPPGRQPRRRHGRAVRRG